MENEKKYRVIFDKINQPERVESVIRLLAERFGFSEARIHMLTSSHPRILLDSCTGPEADQICALLARHGCAARREEILENPDCPFKLSRACEEAIQRFLKKNQDLDEEVSLILVQGETDKQGMPLPSMIGPFAGDVQPHFGKKDLVIGLDEYTLAILCHAVGKSRIRGMVDETNLVFRRLLGGDMPLRVGFAIFPVEEKNLPDLLRRAECRCGMENLAQLLAEGQAVVPRPESTPQPAAKAPQVNYRQAILAKLSHHESLPTLPAVASRVFALAADPSASADQMTEVIRNDVSLTAKLLRVVNSAYYGFDHEIDTVQDAILILGTGEITNLVCSLAAARVFSSRHIKGFCNLRAQWMHSLGTAWLAEHLGMQAGRPRDSVLFTAGLLHDFGKLFLAEHFHEIYDRIALLAEDERLPLVVAENRILGISHSAVGHELARHWNLPASLTEAIAFHHSASKAPNHPEETAMVGLADALYRDLSTEEYNQDTTTADRALLAIMAPEDKALLLTLFKAPIEDALLLRFRPEANRVLEKARRMMPLIA